MLIISFKCCSWQLADLVVVLLVGGHAFVARYTLLQYKQCAARQFVASAPAMPAQNTALANQRQQTSSSGLAIKHGASCGKYKLLTLLHQKSVHCVARTLHNLCATFASDLANRSPCLLCRFGY